jgi:hypothetical protein
MGGFGLRCANPTCSNGTRKDAADQQQQRQGQQKCDQQNKGKLDVCTDFLGMGAQQIDDCIADGTKARWRRSG